MQGKKGREGENDLFLLLSGGEEAKWREGSPFSAYLLAFSKRQSTTTEFGWLVSWPILWSLSSSSSSSHCRGNLRTAGGKKKNQKGEFALSLCSVRSV